MEKNENIRAGNGNAFFYLSLAAALTGLVAFVMAVMATPLSGPFCRASCFQYPYSEIIGRYPKDYMWMYPAILMMCFYLAYMTVLSVFADNYKKTFGRLAVVFAAVSSAVIILDYYIQLSVIQPSLINGEHDGIALLTQYNSHGIFIAMEEAGYLLMGISFLFATRLFYPAGGLGKVISRIFDTAFILDLSALAVITALFGIKREYRFEVAVITINWICLIAACALSAVLFKKNGGHALT